MNNENLNATLRCVTRTSAAQEEKIKTFLKNKYQAENITLTISIDPSVRGGFILSANNDEYDWSTRSRQQQLQEQIQAARDKAIQMKKDGTLMSILKEAIEQFEATSQENEVGYVETIGDGIATISGLDHAMYGEVVVFENGTKGMVLDITTENIGVILFDTEGTIGQGTKVSRTKKQAGMPVSSNFLGRVVDPLGNPIDGLGPIEAAEMRPIEEPAPSIIDRKPVTTPMETGILSIDSMFPIGRGQRELIIGDRQTGKTSIALDTILNQKGKDYICIYVSIAQKASTVANLVNTLKKNDAMGDTVIVNSTAADSASLQYIAPYSATSLAEYFMHQGKDVLIVYDDLSKHAVAYRTISLLLGRSPGREAYPGDVFYLHSRLLERSSRLNSGGSITALPIIETQDGDVSAYIPTNVISITDGLGGLRAAQQLMTPVLKPLLGIPGICSLALIANLQNTDAAAGMTKELAQEGEITERDKVIFAAYQTSGSAIITNYFSSGVAVFAFLGTSVIVPLAVILVFKFVGANILRVWLNFEERRNPTQGAQA